MENEYPIKHQLEYSIWSCKVSWCPVCYKHFYNERNEKHTTQSMPEHYHISSPSPDENKNLGK